MHGGQDVIEEVQMCIICSTNKRRALATNAPNLVEGWTLSPRASLFSSAATHAERSNAQNNASPWHFLTLAWTVPMLRSTRRRPDGKHRQLTEGGHTQKANTQDYYAGTGERASRKEAAMSFPEYGLATPTSRRPLLVW